MNDPLKYIEPILGDIDCVVGSIIFCAIIDPVSIKLPELDTPSTGILRTVFPKLPD
jgi:hypothetical protein